TAADLVDRIRGVEQEGRARLGPLQDVDPVEQALRGAGDEVGGGGQVGGADRLRAEAEVGDGHRARLLGVVDEVALDVSAGTVGDDLCAVLVGPHRAVSTEPEEHRLQLALGAGGGELRVPGQAGEAHVVVDSDGEGAAG